MKQKLLLFGLLTFFGMTTFAKQVDENTAKQVGQNFLATRTNSQTLKNSSSFQLVYKSNSKISNPLTITLQTTSLFRQTDKKIAT